MFKRPAYLFLIGLLIFSCNEKKEDPKEEIIEDRIESDLPLQNLNLPDGFKIELFAAGIDGARSMVMGDDGTLFVGTRNEKTVYAFPDADRDFKADKTILLDTTLESPNGVAFKDGALFVAEVNRLLRYPNIEEQLSNPPEPEVIYDDYPTEFHHGWKYIAFGPDDKLYVPVGAPCNICDSTVSDERYATITRMDPDG
ncbi:MAG: sorbosone dehydrogenase family protein, partial [Flavobacteriaceae bacterium]